MYLGSSCYKLASPCLSRTWHTAKCHTLGSEQAADDWRRQAVGWPQVRCTSTTAVSASDLPQ